MFRVLKRCLSALFILVPLAAAAQSPTDQASVSSELLKPEQLDALVAPIALYPDPLLAVVLMASTYPLEVVQAERWVNENKNLNPNQQKAAIDKLGWDRSVRELVATPSVLSMMSKKLDWTQKLGDAVLAQQPDVMDSIQRLRSRAQANHKLESTEQQTVTVRQDAGRQVIAIEPAVAETIYVPQYDPAVYGDWPYPEYPADYYGWPGYYGGAILTGGIAFGAGYLLGRWASGGNIWGGGINWGNRDILRNRPAHPIAGLGNRWQHDPTHRRGVKYANANVQQRFGNNIRSGSQQRLDFRGRNGRQVLSPDGKRASSDRANRGGNRATANRPGHASPRNRTAANRPGAERRAANRPKVANRGPSQRRASAGTRASHRAGVPGGRANFASQRGRASLGGARFAGARGTSGFRGGGVRGGGGRRSDVSLKHNIVLLGYLDSNIGFYRFSYNGSNRAYVGVIAQEVQKAVPEAVVRGPDGYLRVFYNKLGIRFETYDEWLATGAHIPPGPSAREDRSYKP